MSEKRIQLHFVNTDYFVWKYFTTRISKHYRRCVFFISDHFLAYCSRGTIGKKSVYDLFAVHGQSCQRAAVEKYYIPDAIIHEWLWQWESKWYVERTVPVWFPFIYFFILFTINDFSKSIMTSNFLYTGRITSNTFYS